MPALYADASALVRLVAEETQTEELAAAIDGAELLSSELVSAEVARALRRIATEDSSVDLGSLLGRSEELLETVTTVPVESLMLEAASELPEPALRTLDAIHVVTALYLEPIDAFVTYDVRQAASARREGLRTVAPGA
ncbi:MAG TPA: type II toxin-antitoxin system VapC family toxin [Solirubrobacterales bacterium]